MIERRKRNLPYHGFDRRQTVHYYEQPRPTDDSNDDTLSTVATVLAVESVIDAFSSPDTSTPTVDTPSSDFGGFDGGSSGGGGSSSDW